MKKTLYIVLVSMAAAVTASAQDLDPTVVVDRAYEGKLIEVHKPVLEMAVPDTVFRFDLDFDYSVFENPYKGSYEFQPYLLSMKPAASADVQNEFYLRAGAGYQLRPELDLVWSPEFRNRHVGLDLYADHRSFIGKYLGLNGAGTGPWSGYDLRSRAGADFSLDWNKSSLKAGAGYYGLAGGRPDWKRAYNAFDASLSLTSKVLPHNSRFHYALDAAWRLAGDRVNAEGAGKGRLSENVLDIDASFGFVTRGSMLLFDLGADMVSCTGGMRAEAGQFSVTPHYIFRKGRLLADVGVKVAKTLDSDSNDAAYGSSRKEQIVYPDVNVEFLILRNALKLRLDVVGGNNLNTYGDLLERNHHLDFHSGLISGNVLDLTVERVNASVGLEGRVSSRFSYMARAGFVSYANAQFDCVTRLQDPVLVAGVGYAACQKTFAGLDLAWRSESIRSSASVMYSSFSGDAFAGDSPFLKPAAFTGHVDFEYDWNRRIIAGVDCSFATARENSVCTLPGYADLGIYAEYAMNRRFSLWARGGNLLGMTVQRNPLYAEKGAYFTLGICLNL